MQANKSSPRALRANKSHPRFAFFGTEGNLSHGRRGLPRIYIFICSFAWFIDQRKLTLTQSVVLTSVSEDSPKSYANLGRCLKCSTRELHCFNWTRASPLEPIDGVTPFMWDVLTSDENRHKYCVIARFTYDREGVFSSLCFFYLGKSQRCNVSIKQKIKLYLLSRRQ